MLAGNPAPDTVIRWCGIDASGKLRHGEDIAGQLPAATAVEAVVLPTHYSLHLLELPRQSSQRLRALVPHALDDRLLAGGQQRHFALGSAADGKTRVIACDKAWLQRWVAVLASQGLSLRNAWPLVDLVQPLDEWQRVQLDDGVLLVKGDQSTWFDSAAVASQWLEDQPVHDLAWSDIYGDPIRSGAINLLQGDLTPKLSLPFDTRKLKRTVGILIALFVVLTVGSLWDWWQLRQQATALQRELRQTFAAAFPGTPIVDPILQLQSQLQAAGAGQGSGTASGADFTGLLQRIDGIATGTHLRRLQFENGQLQMELATAEAPALQQKLAGAGFKVDQQPGAVGTTVLRVQGGQK
ncbi:type II secretion system protein GspL [Silvimonas soli]|uniref:type II secretion system protein GspL n=1 Tax=Silvimonas soli TaxID=2980100 RepID=UPI0024B3B180|nr:type II secretion system protein GspL [Silvimonas soli]